MVEIKGQINEAYAQITKLSNDIYLWNISGYEGIFKNALFIIKGGSSLGPRLLNDSIKFDKRLHVISNTILSSFIGNPDQDGIDSILENFRKIVSRENSYRCYIKIPQNIRAAKCYERIWAYLLQERKRLHKKEVYCGDMIIQIRYVIVVGGHTSIFSSVRVSQACLIRVRYQKFYQWC